jgi:hypothetical protein|tara:strand:+ start:39909 stop:40151 length:243 start_codon:yes stop_codon:yes gene_type:complete
MLLRLPLRLRLPVLLTDPFFFSVPLRDGAEPWFNVEDALDAREADRWGMSPSSTDEPRVRASKSSSNLPLPRRSSGALEP